MFTVPHWVRASGGAPAALLLDAISNLGPVYSFRKLLTAYSGNCVRIRRSSDSTEQNFGFSSNVVDAAGIASFIGGGSGFIVTWFDQNGNVVDITNATSGEQPQFIASGIGSLPTARFDGADHLRKNGVTYTDISAATAMTAFCVQNQTGSDAQNTPFAWGTTSGTMRVSISNYNDVFYFDFEYYSTGRNSAAQPGGWDDAGHVLEIFRETGGTATQAIVVDGSSLVSSSTTGTLSGAEPFAVGAFPVNSTDVDIVFTGDISELVFVKADTGSTNRNTIRRDGIGSGVSQSMGDYYGITVA